MKRAAKNPEQTKRDTSKKKKICSICVLVVGLITLIVGVVFLVLGLKDMSNVADGEYLVETGKWTLEDSEGVIWEFTEIGKGTLTTNNHLNDYEFTWAMGDGKLLIETDWLYDLENEYEYKLDQGAGVLTLTDEDGEYKFVAQSE